MVWWLCSVYRRLFGIIVAVFAPQFVTVKQQHEWVARFCGGYSHHSILLFFILRLYARFDAEVVGSSWTSN